MSHNDSLQDLPLFSNFGDVPEIELPSGSEPSQIDDHSQFLEQVKNFSDFGQPSIQFEEEGIPYLVNEFWTSGQRQCHSIHEISYRACFKPQLPEFFIRRLTQATDWVYDPFMGRGVDFH